MRAKQTGVLSLGSRDIATFPQEILKFKELELTENWWDAFDMTKLEM